MLIFLLGMGCLLYTCAELARAWGGPAEPRFGAVDAATGRPLPTTFDRRTRGRRALDR